MLRHECGYEMEILCKKCGKPVIHHERLGLYCPSCGREITLICHGCGRKW